MSVRSLAASKEHHARHVGASVNMMDSRARMDIKFSI